MDTNILIYYFEDRPPYVARVREWIEAGNAAISTVSAAEFLTKASAEEEALFNQLLGIITTLPVTVPIARRAAQLRRYSSKQRRPAMLDCLIAASAIVSNCEFATLNRKDFSFPELKFASFKRS